MWASVQECSLSLPAPIGSVFLLPPDSCLVASELRACHAGRELGCLAALDEVGDDERDDYDNDRECQKPGPPAVSCEEHIDLRCWVRPITKRPCAPSIYLKQRRGKLC